MSVQVSVYALIDPRDGSIRYVGATKKSLEERVRDHLVSIRRPENKAPRFTWLRELAAAQIAPDVCLLETVLETQWAEAEQRWIDHYRGLGADLLNRKPGGGGPKSTATRRPWSSEQVARESARVSATYQADPGLRERVAEGTRRGMARYMAEHGETYRRKVSESSRRRYEDPAARARTGEQSKAMWAAEGFRERHSDAVRAAAAQEKRVKCPSCDMVSRAANIARHRKARGH